MISRSDPYFVFMIRHWAVEDIPEVTPSASRQFGYCTRTLSSARRSSNNVQCVTSSQGYVYRARSEDLLLLMRRCLGTGVVEVHSSSFRGSWLLLSASFRPSNICLQLPISNERRRLQKYCSLHNQTRLLPALVLFLLAVLVLLLVVTPS
jgi:hypothetical protein